MTECCPLCHQPFGAMRFGVRLPQLKAAIIDRIKTAGDIGVSSDEIIADLYRDRRSVQPTTIKAHIDQINDLLVDTAWRIASDHRRWFLTRRSVPPLSAALDRIASREK
jgi:hypothetical protein